MKKISYKKLMEKIDDGYAEVNAWELDGKCCDVTFYNSKMKSRRVVVEVTGCPEKIER